MVCRNRFLVGSNALRFAHIEQDARRNVKRIRKRGSACVTVVDVAVLISPEGLGRKAPRPFLERDSVFQELGALGYLAPVAALALAQRAMLQLAPTTLAPCH